VLRQQLPRHDQTVKLVGAGDYRPLVCVQGSEDGLTVTHLNDFNGPAQTANLGGRSSNLFGRAICHHSE
jgi:hypothetical protein